MSDFTDRLHAITERIRQRAHAIWEREGRPHGRDQEHWDQAEKEVVAEDAAPAEPVKQKAPAKPRTAKPNAAAAEKPARAAKPRSKPAAKAEATEAAEKPKRSIPGKH
jgi:hypothetical protein